MTLVEKAKEIRTILKKEFPGTKFSVRKTSHCAITVSYQDSVPDKLVKKLVKPFESIDWCPVTHEILAGGNDFVFVNREITDKSRKALSAVIDEKYTERKKYPNEYQVLNHSIFTTTDFNKPLAVNYLNGRIVGNCPISA